MSEQDEDLSSEAEPPVKAWVRPSQEWCARHGEYHAEGYAEAELGSGVRIYVQSDAYGNTPVDALQNLRIELALHLPKLQKQLVDAIEGAREAL